MNSGLHPLFIIIIILCLYSVHYLHELHDSKELYDPPDKYSPSSQVTDIPLTKR